MEIELCPACEEKVRALGKRQIYFNKHPKSFLLQRDKEIRDLRKTTSLKDLAVRFDLTTQRIYQILKT